MTARAQLMVFSLLPLVTSCAQTPTTVAIDVSIDDGIPAPTKLDVAVYDANRQTVSGQGNATLPGTVVVRNLANVAQPLRIVIRGRTIAGAVHVTTIPHAQASATLRLSVAPLDTDGDGVPDTVDNCPTKTNVDQADCDGDGAGDVCSTTVCAADLGGFDLGGAGSWVAETSGTTARLNGVFGNAIDVLVAGHAGTLLRSRSGGAFQQVTIPSNVTGDFWAVAYSGTTIIDAVGYLADTKQQGSHCATVHSSDGGNNFKTVPLCGNPDHIYAAWGDGQGGAVIAGDTGHIYEFQQDLDTWNEHTTSAGEFHGVWGSGTNVFAVGNSGTIATSTNSGSSWTVPVTGRFPDLTAIWGSSSKSVFVVGVFGTLLHYDGTTWDPLVSGTTANLRGISGRSDADLYVVGDGGVVLHSTDGGAHLVGEMSGTQQNLTAVWVSASGDVYAVGENGTILHRRP